MSITKNIVKRNLFRDSVQMMFLSQELKKVPGVMDAAMVMGTELNKDTLLRCGMLTNDGIGAVETDTIISLTCGDTFSLNEALVKAENLLTQKSGEGKMEFPTVESALQAFPQTNLVSLSIPGQYVKEVAMKMIERRLHVFVFSDHVSIEDEVSLKLAAMKNNLFFMGPEAGTSIINGVVLGFGNRVRQGSVGIIGASGTGIQESSTLLHMHGEGITDAIGVGGRDLTIGGCMTFQSIAVFEKDPNTRVILIVSKPVNIRTRDRLVNSIKKSKKHYVLCLIGDNEEPRDTDHIKFAKSIQVAVLKSLKNLDQENYEKALKKLRNETKDSIEFAHALSHALNTKQKYIRGLFAGGTLCYEAKVILENILGPTFSNLSSEPEYLLNGNAASKQNTLIDFGNDEFTSSRPHPIIDPSLRISRLLEEAKDPSVRVIIMDIITGHSVAEGTVEQHAEAIRKAIAIAGRENRTIPIFVYLCGTEQDVSESEIKILKKSGAQVFTSNSLMSFTAGLVAKKLTPSRVHQIASDYLGDDLR